LQDDGREVPNANRQDFAFSSVPKIEARARIETKLIFFIRCGARVS
jgi:hypothetical protein